MLALAQDSRSDRPSQRAMADVIGVDKSEVSRFRHGERRMDLDELHALGEEYGVEVLAPLVEDLGGRIVPGDNLSDLGDPLELTFDASAELVDLQRYVASAGADGWNPAECAEVRRRVEGIVRGLRGASTTVRFRATGSKVRP